MDVRLPSLRLPSHTLVMSQFETSAKVWDWLCVLHLEQYSEAFQSAGLATLKQCRNLTPDQLERMGITLPGHQRRILASLNKTHGIRDTQSETHSHPLQSERDQRSEETGNTKLLRRERPVPIPAEEKTDPRQIVKGGGETLRPTPREREKPVPKERQVSRMKEENVEGEEKKPVPEQRQTAPRRRKEEKRDEGIDGEEKKKPVPKERTKFRPSASVNCLVSPLVSPTLDILPPVPPRSTPNCPPQRFTSALSSSPPAQSPGSPKLVRHAVTAQAVQSVSQSSTPISSPTYTFTQTHPQTLAIQPSVQHLVSDGGRKTSPISHIASLSDDGNAPPLPPKVGGGPKCPPPIPLRFPAESPKTHR